MSDKNEVSVIVLAAGKGTRMKSSFPKVLHPAAGEAILSRVIRAVKGAGAAEVRVVVGYGEKLVRQVAEPLGAQCYLQSDPQGTADAVRCTDPKTLSGTVLVMNGDHPLIQAEDISHLVQEFEKSDYDVAVVSSLIDNPGSFGRIVRHHGELMAIVEAKDASVDTLKIKEINTGLYILSAEVLNEYLPQISNNNAQNEFYLTDIISLAKEGGEKVGVIEGKSHIAFGVNSQAELAIATQSLFARKNHQLMNSGVVIVDPPSTFIEEDVVIGESSVIYPNTYIKGPTELGKFCVVEPNCFLVKSKIGNGVHIRAGSYFESAVVNDKAVIGPYARLRTETVIGEEARVGNFVELKKATLGDRSKANHLAYIGDAEIGTDTNIGCGTITCNYAVDKKKYKTKIGNHAFIGSDTQFIAPVSIGDGAVVGSGSTITKDVPEGALAVARGRQVIKESYNKKYLDEKKEETN